MTGPGYDPRAGAGGTPFPTAKVLRTAGPNRALDVEWVLVGWRERGKCVLLASEAVDHATLTFARRPQQFQYLSANELRLFGVKMARHLTADILNYTLIEADTFAECLAALLFGHQWKPDSMRALGSAGMGRPAGPYVQQQPAPPCGAPAFPGSVMHCTEPAGHYPDTDHAHTVTWRDDDPDTIEVPAIEGTAP